MRKEQEHDLACSFVSSSQEKVNASDKNYVRDFGRHYQTHDALMGVENT
jgi:hypothetical protein